MASSNGTSTSYVSGQRVNDLTATEATIDRSAVRSVEADVAHLEKAAVQRLRATQATFDGSTVGFAQVDQATIRQSTAGIVVSRSVACDQVRTGVLFSPVVRGDVHTLLDMRSAVALGVGIVLGKTLLAGAKALGRRLAGGRPSGTSGQ